MIVRLLVLLSKVLVLKPVCFDNHNGRRLNGITRIEKDDSVCSIHLSLVNAYTENGEFVCCVIDSFKKPIFFSLGARPSSFNKVLEPMPNLSNGFAVGIAIVKDYIPQTVAFSCEKNFDFSLTDINKIFAERSLNKRKQEQLDKPNPLSNNFEQQKQILYNDEAVATENYYDNEIASIFENSDREQEVNVSRKNDELNMSCKDKTQESQTNDCCAQTKASAFSCEKSCEEQSFYLSVKRELDQLFDKFPPEEALLGYFSDSRFARVYYSDNKYYVVGVIKENGTPKYICYGVPGTYSPDPPKELKDFCSFIPLSIFDLFGKGFWMMFQSTKDGKCIKKS